MRIVSLLPSSTEIVCKLLKYLHENRTQASSFLKKLLDQIEHHTSRGI